jgi:MoaA/NifB/PqqE/SkfB family radical SAM enzyme
MNIPHDQFCVLPWLSLETSPIGTVRPCCLAEDEILDDQGKKFDLRSADLTAVQNSRHMYQLRQSFLDGERPATCRKCWTEEDAGRTSKRMHTLDRLKHMIHDTEWTQHAKPLMFLDLKLGNICNLKCRICGSWSSSTFATEEITHIADPAFRKSSFHYQMLREGAWPRENKTFWDQIDGMLDQIRYIEFTGGEPFMIQEHFDMLQGMVDRGIAHQVEVHYNTNGTQYPEPAEEIWQHFRTVEIAFSIDDLGERFEYQRSNAVWSEVYDNIERFRQLRARYRNIQLQVCSTVNIFNVWHLEGLAEWIDMQDFDYIYWNMLHEARHFSIASLPPNAKDLAARRLDTATVRSFHRQEFDRMRDFMMAGESMPAEQICEQIYRLDQRRNQDLKKIIWELAESIGYEKDKSRSTA